MHSASTSSGGGAELVELSLALHSDCHACRHPGGVAPSASAACLLHGAVPTNATEICSYVSSQCSQSDASPLGCHEFRVGRNMLVRLHIDAKRGDHAPFALAALRLKPSE